MFYLFLGSLLEKVAPVAARDHQLVGFQFWMNALRPVKQIRVQRIVRVEPDAAETVSLLPRYAFQTLLKLRLTTGHDTSSMTKQTVEDIKINT